MVKLNTTKFKSSRGKLIKKSQEFVKYRDQNCLKDIPRSKNRGSGVYILYKGKKLHYVGLTTNSLRSRILEHTRDRHKGKWNKFSWYQIPKKRYVKDVETLLLRTIGPKGNLMSGKIGKRKSSS